MFLYALFSTFPFSTAVLCDFLYFSFNSLALKASTFSSIARGFYISTLAIIKMLLRNATNEEWHSDGMERLDMIGKE